MNSNEIIREVESIYRMISTILVSGEAVDVMAAARAKLCKIKRELEKPVESSDAPKEV